MKLWLTYPDTLEAIATVIEQLNSDSDETTHLAYLLERCGHLGVYDDPHSEHPVLIGPPDLTAKCGYGHLVDIEGGRVVFTATATGDPLGDERGWLDADDAREAASMCRDLNKILSHRRNSLGSSIEYLDELSAVRIGWFVDEIGGAYGFSFTASPA